MRRSGTIDGALFFDPRRWLARPRVWASGPGLLLVGAVGGGRPPVQLRARRFEEHARRRPRARSTPPRRSVWPSSPASPRSCSSAARCRGRGASGWRRCCSPRSTPGRGRASGCGPRSRWSPGSCSAASCCCAATCSPPMVGHVLVNAVNLSAPRRPPADSARLPRRAGPRAKRRALNGWPADTRGTFSPAIDAEKESTSTSSRSTSASRRSRPIRPTRATSRAAPSSCASRLEAAGLTARADRDRGPSAGLRRVARRAGQADGPLLRPLRRAAARSARAVAPSAVRADASRATSWWPAAPPTTRASRTRTSPASRRCSPSAAACRSTSSSWSRARRSRAATRSRASSATTRGKKLACDAVVVSDTAMLGPGQPSLIYGLRGIAYIEIEVAGPNRDLHSGTFGGVVQNPLNALCEILAGLKDPETGKILIPGFYDDVRAARAVGARGDARRSRSTTRRWRSELGVAELAGEEGFSHPRAHLRRARPATSTASGAATRAKGAKTVLPSRAGAKISMRLVPDQEPEQHRRAVRALRQARRRRRASRSRSSTSTARAPMLIDAKGPIDRRRDRRHGGRLGRAGRCGSARAARSRSSPPSSTCCARRCCCSASACTTTGCTRPTRSSTWGSSSAASGRRRGCSIAWALVSRCAVTARPTDSASRPSRPVPIRSASSSSRSRGRDARRAARAADRSWSAAQARRRRVEATGCSTAATSCSGRAGCCGCAPTAPAAA